MVGSFVMILCYAMELNQCGWHEESRRYLEDQERKARLMLCESERSRGFLFRLGELLFRFLMSSSSGDNLEPSARRGDRAAFIASHHLLRERQVEQERLDEALDAAFALRGRRIRRSPIEQPFISVDRPQG